MKITLKSFSSDGVTYELDKDTGHCSCPGYAENGWCKHLEAVGRYKSRRITLTEKPSYSQALSGLVKSIRIRNVGEAAYWLNYCWSFRDRLDSAQFRTVRRLLIGSAEDGHSIAVMERMADAYISLLSKDAKLEDVLLELLYICKMPNWWHPDSGGPDYIYSGMLAQRRKLYETEALSISVCMSNLEQAINQSDKVAALFWTMKAEQAGDRVWPLVAEKIFALARHRNHEQATRLVRNIYFRHAKSLSADNNFLCQAAWLMAGGVSPVLDLIEPVERGVASKLLDEVFSTSPRVIPGWCCDGIHCAGFDVRYAGMWDRMNAVCNQFKHHRRIEPNDVWLEDEFYSLDGLLLGKKV